MSEYAWVKWFMDDKFGMILKCNEYEMVGYKSDMELVWLIMLCGLLKHVVGMVRTGYQRVEFEIEIGLRLK